MKFLKRLETGRFVSCLVLGAVIGGCVAVVASQRWAVQIGLLFTLFCLGLVFLVQVRWSRRIEGLRRAEMRTALKKIAQLESAENQFREISKRIETKNNKRSALTQSSVSEISTKILSIEDALATQNLEIQSSTREGRKDATVSPFNPGLVRTTQVRGKPSAHAPGRLAADQEMAETSSAKFNQIYTHSSKEGSRKVGVIAGSEVQRKLHAVSTIFRILPGQAQVNVESDVSYLVVDEDHLATGAWAGTLDAQGTTGFLSLMELVDEARKTGCVVIVLAGAVISHFSATLREGADVVVVNGKARLPWNSDIHLPVLQAVAEIN